MQILKKVAATTSAVGLLAFGFVAAGGGSAFASTARSTAIPNVGPGTSITACSAEEAGLAVGLFPTCTAGDATIDNPTAITITLNTTALGSLLNLIPGLGMKATWTLNCDVDGATVSEPGTYTVTSTAQSASDSIDLPTTVGSPEPNSCTVSDLTVTSTVALDVATSLLGLFTVGVGATGTTAVPGAIYQDEGTTKAGAHAVLCADDTGNRNAGSKIQSYQCLSDLADYFVRTSDGQLVHNGDCMTNSGGSVTLATCTGATNQKWSQSTVGGQLTNQSSCLTANSLKDGVQLQVKSCTGKADQKWHAPNVSV